MVAVVAFQRHRFHAHIGGAGDAVVAGDGRSGLAQPEDALLCSVASVGVAAVIVLRALDNDRRSDTLAVLARVEVGESVAVVAGGRVVGVRATLLGVAGIVRTRVGIVAGELVSRANAARADVVLGARVVVIALRSSVRRDESALTRRRVAGVLAARSILRGRARDHGLWIHDALGALTEERTVAGVAVFQRGAVHVGLALAGVGSARAGAARALVARGARVAVVAGGRVVHVLADAPVAGVVGAGVGVVAVDELALADAVETGVARGAGVAVVAGLGVLRLPFHALARGGLALGDDAHR